MGKESMKDMEKQVTEDDSKDALPPVQVEGGGGVAAKMNLKNWRLPYWLIAGSMTFMTNHIHAAPDLIPLDMAMFALFLCGTGVVFLAMKKKM